MLDINAWQSFAVMVGGASGALTGLLFVSVSLNREQIGHSAALRASAAQTLVLLIVPLVVCTLLLIPDQRRWVVGAELIAFAAVAAVVLFRVQKRGSRDERSRIADLVDQRETSLATTLLVLIGAVSYINRARRRSLLAGAGDPAGAGRRRAQRVALPGRRRRLTSGAVILAWFCGRAQAHLGPIVGWPS